MSCSICLENFGDVNRQITLLDCCNNKFHTECLQPWETETNQCPLCREGIDKSKPITKIKIDIEEQNANDFQTAFDMQMDLEQERLTNFLINRLVYDCDICPRDRDRDRDIQYICITCNKEVYSGEIMSCDKCKDYYYCSANCRLFHNHGC